MSSNPREGPPPRIAPTVSLPESYATAHSEDDEPIQLVLRGHPAQALHDARPDLLVLHSLFELLDVPRRERLTESAVDELRRTLWVEDRHGNERRPGRVAVHEQRGKQGIEGIHALELFERDVLALRELDDVFDAVDNLEPAARVDLGDAARQYCIMR